MHLVCKSRSIYSSVLTRLLNEAVAQSIRTGRGHARDQAESAPMVDPAQIFFWRVLCRSALPQQTSPPRQATYTPGPTRRAAYTSRGRMRRRDFIAPAGVASVLRIRREAPAREPRRS
jgi:hypothetical protein